MVSSPGNYRYSYKFNTKITYQFAKVRHIEFFSKFNKKNGTAYTREQLSVLFMKDEKVSDDKQSTNEKVPFEQTLTFYDKSTKTATHFIEKREWETI